MEAFRSDVGRYPTTAEGLQALLKQPASAAGWKCAYLKREPRDPWSNPYLYAQPGTYGNRFDIISLGSDQAAGTAGYITN